MRIEYLGALSLGILVLWGFMIASCMNCVERGGTPVRGYSPFPVCIEKGAEK